MAYVAPTLKGASGSVTYTGWNQDVVANLIAIKAQVDGASSVAQPTGRVIGYYGSTEPSGWLFLSGLTVGDAASGATGRANSDCEDLFTYLWDNLADTEAPVSGGQGLTAAADWAAHKTITLPDGRGRVLAGQDDLGGIAASRLTSGAGGVDGATLGASGGAETHTLVAGELAGHTHAGAAAAGGAHTHSATIAYNTGVVAAHAPTGIYAQTLAAVTTSSGGAHTHALTTDSAGGAGAHANVQPVVVANLLIKL